MKILEKTSNNREKRGDGNQMHKAVFHAQIEYSNIYSKYHSIDKSWPNTMDRTVNGFSIWI